jgi:hypothetical protein
MFDPTVTVQGAVPAQEAPPQPANTYPAAGVAVSVRLVPELNEAEQVVPQLMPVGELVIVPEALPEELVIVAVYCGGGAATKVAVTDWLEVRVTLHAPVPEQAPPQLLKT